MNKRNKMILLTAVLLVVMICCVFFGTSMVIKASEHDTSTTMYKYYTSIELQSGDTLWSIAEEYAYEGCSILEYIDELKQMNGLSSDRIKAGSHLMISYYSSEYKK